MQLITENHSRAGHSVYLPKVSWLERPDPALTGRSRAAVFRVASSRLGTVCVFVGRCPCNTASRAPAEEYMRTSRIAGRRRDTNEPHFRDGDFSLEQGSLDNLEERVKTSQSGIFSLGTASHVYLEWDVSGDRTGRDLVAAIASLRGPRTTIGGVNLVSGFRPELWNEVMPGSAPAGLHGFNEAITGGDGFVMPATQHDAVIWLSGSAYDVLFDTAHQIISDLKGLASVAEETTSWPYRHDRDLTGFVDGTENPSLIDAPEVVCIPEGHPGTGGTMLLLQKWIHDTAQWESLSVHDQEQVMGRTKPDSIELTDKPADSHVARTDQDKFGHVFRRNMPFGTTTHHGTMFVGFCAEQRPLSAMLESMAGVTSGVRDALTRYTHPLTGAYYFVPSTEGLRAAGAPDGH